MQILDDLGAGSGFGAAIARRFGEEGAKVIVADINVEGGEKVAAQNPSNLIFQRTDVTQEEAWKAPVNLAFSKFGRLDVLVNNAGTTYRNKVRKQRCRFQEIQNGYSNKPPAHCRSHG